MSFTLALIGRPNVGKSTLFNRLVGRRLALVHDQPGITRDLRIEAARLGGLGFTVIDTAGLEDRAPSDSLEGRMRQLSERAMDMADICLFMIDARAGVVAGDRFFAQVLRRRAARVVLVANKAESSAADAGVLEAYSLGLGEPLRLSAEHGLGMEDLRASLLALGLGDEEREREGEAEGGAENDAPPQGKEADFAPSRDWRKSALQVAVVGRPNAGKSTLVNRILGEERLLTGPEAGITRDAISVQLNWWGVPTRIFDTAGMRKRARVQDAVEKLSVGDGLRAVRFAHVVVLVVDVALGLEQQDLRLADLAEREGRAIVVVVNKWDSARNKPAKRAALQDALTLHLPQLRGVSLIPVSGKTGYGLRDLHKAIRGAYRLWNQRTATATLNRWLAESVHQHPPPAPQGRRIKLRYMAQVKTRPPAFVIMCSRPALIPDSYRRYLVNKIREDFALPGVPLRLTLRGQADDNPYRGCKKPAPSRLRKHLR